MKKPIWNAANQVDVYKYKENCLNDSILAEIAALIYKFICQLEKSKDPTNSFKPQSSETTQPTTGGLLE